MEEEDLNWYLKKYLHFVNIYLLLLFSMLYRYLKYFISIIVNGKIKMYIFILLFTIIMPEKRGGYYIRTHGGGS